MPPGLAGEALEIPGAVPVPPSVAVLAASPASRREASPSDSSGKVAPPGPAGKSVNSPPNGPSAIAGQTWVSKRRKGAGRCGSTERTLPPGLAAAGLSGDLVPAWRVTAPASLVTSAGMLFVAVSANSVATSFATSLPDREGIGGGVTAGGSAETFGGGRLTFGGRLTCGAGFGSGRLTCGTGGTSTWICGADGGGAGSGATTERTGSGSEEVTVVAEEVTVVTVSLTTAIEAEAEEAPTSDTTEISPASEIALPRIFRVDVRSVCIAFSRYPKCGQIYYIFR